MRTRTVHLMTLATILLLIFSAGCTPPPSQPATALLPAASEQLPPATPDITSGTVVETMASGGYTYLRIENSGRSRWAAVPQTDLEVGMQVQLGVGIEMSNFNSRTLDRTFPTIYFSKGITTADGTALPSHPAPEHGMQQAQHGAMGMTSITTAAKAEIIAGKVSETFDGGGYTYVAVEKDGKQTWVAVPVTQVTVGEEVAFRPGVAMQNFTSKALGRTFATIIFSAGIAPSTPATGKMAPSL